MTIIILQIKFFLFINNLLAVNMSIPLNGILTRTNIPMNKNIEMSNNCLPKYFLKLYNVIIEVTVQNIITVTLQKRTTEILKHCLY